MQNRSLRIILAICAVWLTGCCNYPRTFSADSGGAKAVLVSPSTGQAHLDASMSPFAISPPIKCPPSARVLMAPAGDPDENGHVHFGAFAVVHGQSEECITMCWWSLRGELRTLTRCGDTGERVTTTWLNEQTIQIRFGPGIKTFRLNEDDGAPYTEL